MKAAAAVLVAAFVLTGCTTSRAAAKPCDSVAACLFGPEPAPLRLVVHSSPGLAASPRALGVLAQQTEGIAGRGLEVRFGDAVPAVASNVSEPDLHALMQGGGGELHLYVVNATHWVGSERASGLSFPGEGGIFLFPATMDARVAEAGTAPAGTRDALESVVLVHEFGHVLGLVDCGAPMLHPHAAGSACHSSNSTSVMHERVAHVRDWPAGETGSPLGPFGWDSDDRADLAALAARLRDL